MMMFLLTHASHSLTACFTSSGHRLSLTVCAYIYTHIHGNIYVYRKRKGCEATIAF